MIDQDLIRRICRFVKTNPSTYKDWKRWCADIRVALKTPGQKTEFGSTVKDYCFAMVNNFVRDYEHKYGNIEYVEELISALHKNLFDSFGIK